MVYRHLSIIYQQKFKVFLQKINLHIYYHQFQQHYQATPTPTTNQTITIETDTVTGASPYIFNVSLRSVFGMNGVLADGAKATGFKSIVVAQFTGVSLQKDDRAFVKYNPESRKFESITINLAKGATS